MKIQRNTVYLTCIFAIISFILSYIFNIFNILGEAYTFQSNLFLNVFGGSVLALILALIAYYIEKKENLEQYYSSYNKLYKTCSSISSTSTSKEYVTWFERYQEDVEHLSFAWSKIAFLYDYYEHRTYLKSILDYYCDFTLLTQNQFRLLNENINDNAKESLKTEINDYLFETITHNQGILQSKTVNNKLTSPMIIHNNNIYKIYIGKTHVQYHFTAMLFNQDNFKIYDKTIECVIRKIIKQSELTGSTSVEIDICNSEPLSKLKADKNITDYRKNANGTKYNIDANFILFHYFDIKKRLLSQPTPEYTSFTTNIVTLILSLCFLFKQLWNIFFSHALNTPEKISPLVSFSILIFIYISLSLIHKFWRVHSSRSEKILSELGTNFTWLSIIFFFISDILPDFQNQNYLIIGFITCIFLSLINIFFAVTRRR